MRSALIKLNFPNYDPWGKETETESETVESPGAPTLTTEAEISKQDKQGSSMQLSDSNVHTEQLKSLRTAANISS